MKFFLDENLSPKLAEILRASGHASTCALEEKLSGADDHAIREFCIKHAHVLVTLDSDFGNVLRFPPNGTPGVIWLRPSGYSNQSINILMMSAIAQLQHRDLKDMLAVVDQNNIRIRPGVLSS